MAPPQIKPKGDDGMHTCDIMIFDEERDCHVRVTWEDALAATLVEDDEFMTDRAKATTMQDGENNTTTLDTWAGKARAWSAYNKGGQWADTLDKDVRIVVARPFIECVPARSAPAARCLSHPAGASCAGTSCTTWSCASRAATPVPLAAQTPMPHEPRPDRLPSNYRRRHALRPGGHATLS